MAAALVVKHRVADFEAWKVVFDSMQSLRLQHGWLGHTILRDAADPNVVTVVNRVSSLEGAKAYGSSPDLRAAMQKAGVQGPPDISFCDEQEMRVYG